MQPDRDGNNRRPKWYQLCNRIACVEPRGRQSPANGADSS